MIFILPASDALRVLDFETIAFARHYTNAEGACCRWLCLLSLILSIHVLIPAKYARKIPRCILNTCSPTSI